MDGDKIKSKFMTSKKHTTEVNGETKSSTTEEPDNEKMAEATNRALALTHAYALFIELNRIQDEQDVQDGRLVTLETNVADLQKRVKTLENKVSTLEKKTSTLESKVSSLESDVKWLKSKHII